MKLEPRIIEYLEMLWDEIGTLENCHGCRKVKYSMTAIMAQTLQDNGFQSFIVIGGKGNGKSTYAIKSTAMYYMIYEDYPCGEAYQEALKKIAFSAKDLLQRIDEGHKIVIWDDAGYHGSTYYWYDEEMRQYIIALVNWYDVARTDINVLIMTTPTKKKLPPTIRSDPDAILVNISKHGKIRVDDIVFKQSRAIGVRNIESLYEEKTIRTDLFKDLFIVYLPDPVYELYYIIRKQYSKYARKKLKKIIKKIDQEHEEEYIHISRKN